MKKRILLSFVLLGIVSPVWSAVRLPGIISDHMVLERSAKVPIWGTASAGEEVTVILGQQTQKTKAGADGKWRVALDLKDSAAGPFELVVKGENTLTVKDVLVGEVWLASGQSNMEWRVEFTNGAAEVIAQSANPQIRQYTIARKTPLEPLEDTQGAWVVASPETTNKFSAVGYFFARRLQAELKTPVGIINSSWGGTPSEAWTSKEALDSVPDLKEARERLWKVVSDYPVQKKAFVDGMTAWIKETGREDKPSDAAPYVGANVSSEGWTAVKLPGEVRGPGLPEAGVVWLRKEIDLKRNGQELMLHLPIDGFDSVYWNGRLLQSVTYQEFPGLGAIRRYGAFNIKDADVLPGKNVLAVRLYMPAGPAKFSGEPRAGSTSLAGEWMAKAETAFPETQAKVVIPPAPVNPTGPQNVPTALFNGMINPIIPYAISGVIWYQGESNAGRSVQYREAFPLLIKDWREHWGQGEFPFYFVQLANFLKKKDVPTESGWAELREAQDRTLSLPNTGQAVTIDIGESDDIHPRNKKDVGERLAAIALARDYGKKEPFSGPTYAGMKVEEDKVVLSFKDADKGLVAKPLAATYDVKTLTKETAPLVRNSPQSELEGFAICGEDKKWLWASAKIEGDTVVVWSEAVKAPVAVRYGWADNPTCNLYNGAGFPASPFRTDEFPETTRNGKL